jgi:hypothetical protein
MTNQVDVMIEMAKDSDKLESENFIEKVNNTDMSKTPRTDAVWERFRTDTTGELEPDVEFSKLARGLEEELNNALEKINRLKKAGDVMYALLNPPSICMRTTEYDNALQGWDDAKIS